MFLFRYCVLVLNSAQRTRQLVGRTHRSDEARARASAGCEHCTHTDASNLASLVPLSRRAAFLAESEAELAACKALARFDQASHAPRAPPERSAPVHGRDRALARRRKPGRPAREFFE